MTIRAGVATVQALEAGGVATLLLLVSGVMLRHSGRRAPRAAQPGIQPEIVDALSVYLCGNRDTGRLRALAATHPDEVRETVLKCQTVVSGRREELRELAFVLGYVQPVPPVIPFAS